MEDGIRAANEIPECEVHVAIPHLHFSKKSGEVPQWTNGQCVLAVPTSCKLCLKFDIPKCRTLLERHGFNIPVEDFDRPLQVALGPSSVRRYLLFYSFIFHVFLAMVVYIAVWCGLYSTIHLYLKLDRKGFWLLCASVSLASIFFTSTIMIILNHSNKQININTDVRLIQVNERLWKHRLLVGLDDSAGLCAGTSRLCFLFCDLSSCLTRLTSLLEEMKIAGADLQSRLHQRMWHLQLGTEVSGHDMVHGHTDQEQSEESRPLLVESQRRGCNTTNGQKGVAFTKTYNLVPDQTLSSQVTAYRLLMTYSATYVKLMVSQRLPEFQSSSLRPLCSDGPHCTVGPICLCQYVQMNVL